MENKMQGSIKHNQPSTNSYQPFQQVQNDRYISQINSNNSLVVNQQPYGVNLNQNQSQAQPTDFYQQFLKCCFGTCGLVCFFIIYNCFSLVFGLLFFFFQRDPEKYNNCSNDKLREWSFVASITLFVNIFASTIRRLEQNFFNSQQLSGCIDFSLTIAFLVTVIGLTVNITSDCGQLYLLASIFCGFFYFVIGILLFGFCVIFIIKSYSRTR